MFWRLLSDSLEDPFNSGINTVFIQELFNLVNHVPLFTFLPLSKARGMRSTGQIDASRQLLGHVTSSVHIDTGTVHVTGVVGGEKCNDCGHFFGLGKSPQRNV